MHAEWGFFQVHLSFLDISIWHRVNNLGGISGETLRRSLTKRFRAENDH